MPFVMDNPLIKENQMLYATIKHLQTLVSSESDFINTETYFRINKVIDEVLR